ncbi:MAG: YMGG-like glycine zipper-containing protein [Paracoccaceae bacterium]
MKKILLILPILSLLGACDQLTTSQQVGALGGAALGAAVSPDGNKVQGAIIGSAVGLAAGSLISHKDNGGCIYQRPDGSRYEAACPAGY